MVPFVLDIPLFAFDIQFCAVRHHCTSDDFPSFMGGSKFKEFSIYGVQSSTWNWDRWVSAIWLNCASKKKLLTFFCVSSREGFSWQFSISIWVQAGFRSLHFVELSSHSAVPNEILPALLSLVPTAKPILHTSIWSIWSLLLSYKREKHCLNRALEMNALPLKVKKAFSSIAVFVKTIFQTPKTIKAEMHWKPRQLHSCQQNSRVNEVFCYNCLLVHLV